MSLPIVINLGLPKSGTTTLARALREAGFTVADYRIRPADTENPELRGRFVGGLIYEGYFTTGDPLEHLEDFNAFTEINKLRRGHSFWPQTDFGVIEAIRQHHPSTRFLASSRNPRDHAMSLLRWSDLGSHRLPKLTVPGLPVGYGETGQERARWISAHHAFLDRIFDGDPNYLKFDIANPEAREKIAAHLGCDLPWWGRLNVNSTDSKSNNISKVAS
ncbi:hypothetical protein RXV86_04745 [Alisedimentitalea sp. MJ-SS2]|uniref:hypothetical protein n=1 Tax=Aliisedimentitalea sp. MJ-SS2 TaxID=3049795 RepID=UPI00290A23F9|nr:hypothetical protein [Alisedimentitalea sp. MJ-SS2]MDU8926688.1 hypothetical protein [Alisedimentitalea sp. MJ-SS2]